MAVYEDLTAYTYGPSEDAMVNVGWLGRRGVFEAGEVHPDVVDELLRFADNQQNIMRGGHYCEFCDQESPIRMAAPVPRGWVSLGMGEIHVPADSGAVFAAPSLIVHYITAHGYQPPKEFRDAVRALAEVRARPANLPSPSEPQ